MGQLLHGCARTTEAVRRAIQHSQASLSKLASQYGINPKTVVVERNLRIVDRGKFILEALEDGDQIEIIRLVGGG